MLPRYLTHSSLTCDDMSSPAMDICLVYTDGTDLLSVLPGACSRCNLSGWAGSNKYLASGFG